MSQVVKKVTSSSVTTSQKTSSSYQVQSTSKTAMQSSSTSQQVIRSDGGPINMDAELSKMSLKMDEEMSRMKTDMLKLMPLTRSGEANELVKLDQKTIEQFADEGKKALRFNFDVNEFKSESVVVKAEGNQVHVHAKKVVRTGDDEQTEEYSKSYELPAGVEPGKVTSSLAKPGVLTIELPVAGLTEC